MPYGAHAERRKKPKGVTAACATTDCVAVCRYAVGHVAVCRYAVGHVAVCRYAVGHVAVFGIRAVWHVRRQASAPSGIWRSHALIRALTPLHDRQFTMRFLSSTLPTVIGVNSFAVAMVIPCRFSSSASIDRSRTLSRNELIPRVALR